MLKRSRLITLLCIIILGVVATLSVTLISILPDVSDSSARKLVFVSDDGAKNYDGTPLTVNGKTNWKLISGDLKSGHTAEVTMKGSQKNVGKSDNYFTVKIRDEDGIDVTDEYEIDSDTVEADVDAFINTLQGANILE